MCAQVGIGKVNPVNLVVVNGAKIYSTDDHFNQQIFTGKTLVKNSNLSYINNEKKDRSLLLTERKSVDVKKNLSNQLIVAQEKRRKNDLKKYGKK